MMKLTHRVLLVLLLLALATAAKARETWDCRYEGTWSQDSDGSGGSFVWNVTWTQAAEGWTVAGDYRDDYGNSFLDGVCDRESCALKQVYTNGSLKGREYFWVGEYAEKSVGRGRVVNGFSGVWGQTLERRDGAWDAVAVCDLR